jgi:ADP-heptose:LPS heptosyltransferase
VAVLEGEALPLAARIASGIPGARVLPRRPLRVAAAVLEHAALLVSGDSGLAHVANAVGTPVLGLYGPTWAGRYGAAAPSRNLQSAFDCPELNPMNFTLQRCWAIERCIYPYKTTCSEDISPEAALAEVRDLIGAARPMVRRRMHA